MSDIQGKAKTVRELLKGMKYSIDYYQREYKWGKKQACDLIDDLTGKFLQEHQPHHPRVQVAKYPHYFLGAIIISKKDGANHIVDGQQRLTSLTLLLVLLRNLQLDVQDPVNVDELILSEKYGKKTFNMDIEERVSCMDALFHNQAFDATDGSESVKNLHARYHDMQDEWPEELRGKALPYFVDWLQENVHLVEITADSDDDAYTIFETMNDRGLSLSPTDMLKGYILANMDESKRNSMEKHWRQHIAKLKECGDKDIESNFFKAWLRSQYAKTIRERSKGAAPQEFDLIGTEFHRWLRAASEQIGLISPDAFFQFIDRDFTFYIRQYQRIMMASKTKTPELEHIHYNAQHGFTLQNMVLLSPLCTDDKPQTITQKLRLTAHFLDILLARRLWNSRSTAHSTMEYAMFLLMRDIRSLSPPKLAEHLHEYLGRETEPTFADNDNLRLHGQNRRPIHHLLARLTDYIETSSGQQSRYTEYMAEGAGRYEIEHIWADHFEPHRDEFEHPTDFSEHRNRIGALLLLPKSFNASCADLPYEEKLPHYRTQNLLAHSLHPECLDRNPGFKRFADQSGLLFKSHTSFKKSDIDARSQLYRQLAERIWNPSDLLPNTSP